MEKGAKKLMVDITFLVLDWVKVHRPKELGGLGTQFRASHLGTKNAISLDPEDQT